MNLASRTTVTGGCSTTAAFVIVGTVHDRSSIGVFHALHRSSSRLVAALCLAVCDRLDDVGQAPEFVARSTATEVSAMTTPGLPRSRSRPRAAADAASLWQRDAQVASRRPARQPARRHPDRGDRDRRQRRDLQQHVRARGAAGRKHMGIPQLFGLPQRLDERLPDGASMADAVDIDIASSSSGDGSVRRNEELDAARRRHRDRACCPTASCGSRAARRCG